MTWLSNSEKPAYRRTTSKELFSYIWKNYFMKRIYLLLIVFIHGCGPVLKLVYDVHDPKPETKQSLIHYLERKNIRSDNILVAADSASCIEMVNRVRNFPTIRVFDRAGNMVYYKDTTVSCSAAAYGFTASICSLKELPLGSSWLMKDEIAHLVSLDGQPVKPGDGHDYTVFIYWARFTGRLNKVEAKEWEESILKSGCNVTVYKVSIDWMESWNTKSPFE